MCSFLMLTAIFLVEYLDFFFVFFVLFFLFCFFLCFKNGEKITPSKNKNNLNN